MNLKFLVGIVLCVGMCFSCKPKPDDVSQLTDKEVFFRDTPDATLDFYCAVNEKLTDAERLSIHDLADNSEDLWAELIIRKRRDQIDTVKIVAIMEFDANEKMTMDTAFYQDLSQVLNSIDETDLAVLGKLRDGSYLYRLHLTRFCSGYVNESPLENGAETR